MRAFRKFWVLYLLLNFYGTVIGQMLPNGKLQRVRERTIDILHYRAELRFDFDQRIIHGTATVAFRPLMMAQSLELDAIRLDIEHVQLIRPGHAQSLAFVSLDTCLKINLGRNYSWQDTLVVAIRYSAQPNAGLYFLKDHDRPGQYFIYSYGEGGLLANWLPIYNDVNDKFSSETLTTVPPPYEVISNGTFMGLTETADGQRTFHWKQTLPHANYLMAIYIGEFERGELAPAFGTIPLGFWVPKGRLNEGAYAFRNTTKMIEFFSNRFNYRYPWDKYDQVAFPDYAIGAMEHTSASGHRISVLRDASAPDNFGPPDFDRYYQVWSADGLISHELAHHWFGNNITCRSLSYIWLNESFATYCNMLWDEFHLGKDAFDLVRREALDRYLNYVAKNHQIRPLEYAHYDTPGEVYIIEITYYKGALVLHTLREILGDDAFFATLSHFLHEHQFSNVISSEFKTAIEDVTGKNVDWFFDDWIYGAGYPIFEVNYQYLPGRKAVDLTVKQVQPIIEGQDFFTLPVEITIATPSGQKAETVWVKNRVDQFLLDCTEAPLMVSFDGKGALVAEVKFNKSLRELIYQIQHDDLPGRIWALRQLAHRFPTHPKSLQVIEAILSGNDFWGLKAEASRLLGELRSPEAKRLLSQALQAKDYHIRKAAVLAMPSFELPVAEPMLKQIIRNDPHSDVVATAIVALARTNPETSGDFIRKQMNRPSWYDEIRLSCLKGFEIIGDPRFLSDIRPFAEEKYHEHLRNAAFDAWRSCQPEDPLLHRKLMDCVEDSPPGVKSHAVELLGGLHVFEAIPILEKLIRESGDRDLRARAERALRSIRRIGR